MRSIAIAIAVVALAGCSCHRTADQDTGATTSLPTASTPAASAAATAKQAPMPPATEDPGDAQARAGFAEASATVQRYLGALPGAARADADALWAGGRPSPVPDDAVLRGIGDIRSMRINNDPPMPLDQESPPRRIEVPVRITVRTGSGTQQLVGAYRLQPRAGSDNWEIYSATLHPVLR
ncbi:hypothetical protein BJD12_05530 [Xanthomonas vesicatoria ATCC 35937]|uniref:Lipoprotein n=3 Tax=Xanthomonas vesicatoria TaxID=56460 RepID=A0AAJ0N4F5_9XANT|nr:hypothetical protein BI313_08140 [Xanthomonas vesicatoria]APP74805.1 hypothetical protein BJD12_05530 [Xanthomonas vesicatoria ATCC 35937]KHM95443.1 hypothetical protein OR61_08980 [Xanthomonas vesicatoria]KHM98274.1 hypothetical protein OR60_00840 [Xanthomonas vesicatoria]KTF29842.1 hypothetical protein LMG920_21275 [Xanthomonas vesicatoria]